jgi:hypothetical protein
LSLKKKKTDGKALVKEPTPAQIEKSTQFSIFSMFTSEIVGAVLVPWSTSPTSIASQQSNVDVTDLDDVIDIHFPYVCLSLSKRVFRRVLDRTGLARVGANRMIVFPARI